MNIACLMDPLETINIKKDTSYAILKEAEQQGHTLFYVPKTGLSIDSNYDNPVFFTATKITTSSTANTAFDVVEASRLINESEIDRCFIRTDPPFDETYLYNTWVLDQCTHTKVVNNPTGIRTVNEKIWASQFSKWTPKTLISSSVNTLKEAIHTHKKVVIKPIDGFGGQSIFIITEHEKNLNALLETLTQNGTKAIICQDYIEDATNGDKRILLLNGDPLGAVLRHHSSEDPRNNFFAGGTALKAEITDADSAIIKDLKPFLLAQKLFFVGIDIIGNKLIEINVTSPTCLQEMSELNQENLAAKVVHALESLI